MSSPNFSKMVIMMEDELNLPDGYIECATCGEMVDMNSEDMVNDYHVGCGPAR